MPLDGQTPCATATSAALSKARFEAAIAATTLEERCEFHVRYDRLKQAQSRLGSDYDSVAHEITCRLAHELANFVQRLTLRKELSAHVTSAEKVHAA